MAQAPVFGLPIAGLLTGYDLVQALNGIHDAFATQHSGAARPDYAAAGMLWIDTVAAPLWSLKLAYGDDDDLTLGTIDTATGLFTLTAAIDDLAALTVTTLTADTVDADLVDAADATILRLDAGEIEAEMLAIGTDPDVDNPFAAKLNNALWTARTAAEGGSGDLRYKMNKEGAANVLSHLFQSDYEGRAEFGLVGDDDIELKVSADGETWKTAFKVDRSSGAVDFPNGGTGIGGEGGGGGSSEALELSVSLLSLQVADMANAALGLGNRWADSLDSLTYVDVGGATNLDSGTGGLLKPTATAIADAVPAMTSNTTPSGTVSATSFFSAGTAAWYAFDNAAATTAWLSSAVPSGGAPQEISYDFGANTSIGSYTVRNAGNSALANYDTRAPNAWTMDGWNGTSWVTLDTRSSQSGWGDAEQRTFTLAATATGYSKYRLRITANNGGPTGVGIGEIEFRSPVVTNNVTVRSAAIDFGFVPADMRVLARLKVPSGAVLNTDSTFEVSRDNGATWASAALTQVGPNVGGMIVAQSDWIDVGGQPSGQTLRWRWKTLTNKAFELHDVYLSAQE